MPATARMTPNAIERKEMILSALPNKIAPNIKKTIALNNDDCDEYDFTFISILDLFSFLLLYNKKRYLL